MKILFFPTLIFLFFISGFPGISLAGVGKAVSSLSHFKRPISDINFSKGLEDMGINPNSLGGILLEIFENSWDNPLKLVTDYGFSLNDILDSDVHRTFFFSRLNLWDEDQTDELFYHLMPKVEDSSYYGTEISSSELGFPSEFWSEFVGAMEEAAGHSEITKVDLESAFITHLGSFSRSISSSGKNRFAVDVYPEDSWIVNTTHPAGTFFKFAIKTGTGVSEVLTNPHFTLNSASSSMQEVVKVTLGYPSRIDEIFNSKGVVLKIWEAVKDNPSAVDDKLMKVNQGTFRKYVVRHFRKNGRPESSEDIVKAVEESSFLSSVFEALKEDSALARLLEDVFINNIAGGSDREFLRRQTAWVMFRNRTPEEANRLADGNPIFSIFRGVFSGPEQSHYIEEARDFVPLSVHR